MFMGHRFLGAKELLMEITVLILELYVRKKDLAAYLILVALTKASLLHTRNYQKNTHDPLISFKSRD